MQVCMDINECEQSPGLCRGGKCINTPGLFHCECPQGLELTEDGRNCKVSHSGPRNLKNSRQKNLVKSYKSIFFREIAFLTVLNLFPVQKFIFGHF